MCLKVYNNMILGNHIKNQYGERIDKIIKNCLTLSLIIKDYILEYNPSEEVTKQLKKFSEEVNKMIFENYSDNYTEYYSFIKDYLEQKRNNITELIDHNSELFCVLNTSHLLVSPDEKQIKIAKLDGLDVPKFAFILIHYKSKFKNTKLNELIQFTSKESEFILNYICSTKDAIYI